MLQLLGILLAVSPSSPQPPLSLPARLSVMTPPWQYLPLSQAEVGPLFSNSSPFSFSQSLLMVPPPGQAPKPGLRASFGPYSVTQPVSEPLGRLSLPLRASLLSDWVERERAGGSGQDSYSVRAVFHARGEGGAASRGTCVTLHAFRETQEHKASCVTQPPLGLCTVTLPLPSDWFETRRDDRSHPGLDTPLRHTRRRHRRMRRERLHGGDKRRRRYAAEEDGARTRTRTRTRTGRPRRYRPGVEEAVGPPGSPQPGHRRGPAVDRVQLYYSTFGTVGDLKLSPSSCVEDRLSQYERQLFFIKATTLRVEQQQQQQGNSSREEASCLRGQEGEELRLDPNVLIRYHAGPVTIGQPLGVSVNLRANLSAQFVTVRLRVKRGLVSMVAQRTLTSDLWAVTLEKSQGTKHDVISIICHKHSPVKHTHRLSVPQQVVCLSVSGLRRSFGVAMTVPASWWVEYSGRGATPPPQGAAVSSLSFADRRILGVAPVTESDSIINTAILTGERVLLPVVVLAVDHDGEMSDVTAAVRCWSTNEDILKVSSDCSTLFVDGSESGVGSTCARVEFALGALAGSVCLSVWAPSVPLRVSLSDPVLNAIQGWSHLTDRGCSVVFQRSSVQVLTRFTAQDAHGGVAHLMGSTDWLVDVTELVRDWLRVDDPEVAALEKASNLIGLKPGSTSLHVVSGQWDGVLGRCDITVTSEPVAPGDLSVQVVSGLGLSITSSPTHPSVVTTTVTAHNILHDDGQEASISVWLQFSDDTASLLSSFGGVPSILRLSSLAESVVAVTPGPAQRVVARGDGGGPLLMAELMVFDCAERSLALNLLLDGGEGGGGGARRLARGSGWIRVNLDLDFLEPAAGEDGEGEEFEFDLSDTLVDSGGDVYTSSFDPDAATNGQYPEDNAAGRGRHGDGNHAGTIGRNNLERAVLTPSHEEGAVYLSPGQERAGAAEEEEERRRGAELDVGVGAVLALLCLSTLLFLANCVPCALGERKHRGQAERTGGEAEGGAEERRKEKNWEKGEEVEEEEEWVERRRGLSKEDQDGDEVEVKMKGVEIIC